MSVNNDYTHSFESLAVRCYILERVQESVEGGQNVPLLTEGLLFFWGGGGIKWIIEKETLLNFVIYILPQFPVCCCAE